MEWMTGCRVCRRRGLNPILFQLLSAREKDPNARDTRILVRDINTVSIDQNYPEGRHTGGR